MTDMNIKEKGYILGNSECNSAEPNQELRKLAHDSYTGRIGVRPPLRVGCIKGDVGRGTRPTRSGWE